MKKLAQALLLFAILLIFSTTKLSAQNYNIILGRPTDTSITASILFDNSTSFYLEYGTNSTTYSNQTPTFNISGGVPMEVDIKALLGDTKYYYRMQYKVNGVFTPSPQYSFHTQRKVGSTFTFTVEADEHLYDIKGVKNMYRVTLANEAADNPDFMFSLGDIFGDDHDPFTITSGGLDSLHKDYRPFLGSICHSIPFYVCLGNHEGENDYYQSFNAQNNLCVWGTQWRQYYYPNPYPNKFYSGNTQIEPFGIGYPENYYAWTWGDALFVVLDVYRTECHDSLVPKPTGWNWTLGQAQYNWLKTTLENSNSKYKFVFAHHLRGQGRGGVAMATTNEWGGNQNTNGNYTFPINRPGWAKPIHKLFVDNKVTMFVQGHDHVFAHEVLDSITYISTPMAADSTYEIGMLANADAYVSDTVDGTGHLRFTVSPDCVKMDYVKAYLPQDTNGVHKNREIGFSKTIGTCKTSNGIYIPSKAKFSIQPNPANENILIKGTSNIPLGKITIVNALGECVWKGDSNESVLNIPTNNFSNGLYRISIEKNGTSNTESIIIQH
ncbi:MAG: hypothetical protein RL138_579 [Bacteroidota bacterium]